MASHLDRWERDPFFPAAEEVQESADRMESTYRTLIHASKEPSVWNSETPRRDLRTAIGTTKWQLEEFERAVVSSYGENSTDNTKDRHRDFINAMENQISRVENSWNDSAGKPPRPWLRLDERERKELAEFLAGSPASGVMNSQQRLHSAMNRGEEVEAKENKFPGHRRAASASADIGSWNITVDDDNISPNRKIDRPPRKMPSFSGLLNTLESASKSKWPKDGYKKLSQEADTTSSESKPLTRGNNPTMEKSKNFHEHRDDHYDKRLHGWYGVIHRQFQRSQYYMMYSRRTRMIFSCFLAICLLALVLFHLI